MSVKRRVNWVSQQRVDTPDMRSIESAASNDFDELLQTLIFGTAEGYILRGFEISMAGVIGGAASGAQMLVDQAAILHPRSSQSGTFLVVPAGTPPQVLNSATSTIVDGAFSPSSLNYVGIEYERFIDDTTASQVYIWDPTINDETTKVIPRAQILRYRIKITTGTWATSTLPVCIITTDAGNNVISVEDTRRMLFRLGTAGRTAPNPFFSYPWNAQPEGRTESPFISSSNSVDPFHGGDKMLGTQKDWMDAIMTVIKEIKGSAFWYTAGSSAVSGINLSDIFFDAVANVLTMRGKFIHSKVTPGQLTWSGDIHVRSIIGPLTYTVAPSNVVLADKQVAYISLVRNQLFQPTNVFTFLNGSNLVTGTSVVANIFAGDWVKFFSDDLSKWAQVLSVSGNTITLTSNYLGTSGSGAALRAQGTYLMFTADPENVPATSDTFWIAKRDDNGAITATIDASPVGAVRVGGITTFQTTAPHGINAGQGVSVTGVTDTSFNNLFEVLSVPAINQFTVQNTGPDATSGSGTVNSTATIYLRGIGPVTQGSSQSDDSSTIEALLQYTGSAYAGDTQPQYPSTNYVTQGIDLTTAIGELDLQAGTGTLISEQDRNLKLVRGGDWLFVNPTLSWSADAFIQVPGLPENRNRIPAGNVTLSNDGDVAYVEINRNTGAPANLTVSVAQISSLVATNNTVIIARKFGGGGISVGTEVGTLALTAPSQEWIDNDKLYVVGNGQLRIYDLSVTPDAPTLLGFVAIVGASSICVVSNTAYVGSFSGGNGQFNVVDVTTPATPTVLGTATLAASETIAEIRVIGTRAFAHTVTGIPTPTEVGDIRVIDVSTPATPTVVGTNTTYGGNLLGGNIDNKPLDTYLYKAGGDRVNIFDGTTNSATLLSDYMAGFTQAARIAVNTTHLFITDNANNQLTIHSLAVPAAPTLVATLSLATAPYTIKVLGTLLYIYHSVGNILTIVDITTPASPTIVYSGAHVVSTFELFPNDDLVYLLGTTTRIVQAIASGGTNRVVVGSHSFLLISGESKSLDAGISDQNSTYLGIADESVQSPAWNSQRSSPLRFIPADTTNVSDTIASNNIELDKLFGQFRLRSSVSPDVNVSITGSDVIMLSGETLSQSISNLQTAFTGASINFQTGVVTGVPGSFTPVIPAAGMYRWFSIGMLPSATTGDQRLNLQVLVIPASGDGASLAAAPKAPFSSDAFNLGQIAIHSTNGSTVDPIPMSYVTQLGIGSGGSGSGSGSGVGDDLDSLTYRASFRDVLKDLPSSASNTIDYGAGKTDPNTFSLVNHYYRLAYDASKTIAASTTATDIFISASASYTVKVGDIVRVATEARRIITVISQSHFTVEGTGFTFVPTLGQQVTISQAVYTQDINNFSGTGQPISASLTDNINDLIVQYGDSITLNDTIPDWNFSPRVAFDVSTNGAGNPTDVGVRVQGFDTNAQITIVPNPGTNLYLRFFSNFVSGSGFVNLLSYRLFFHREPVADFLPQLDQASGRTDGAGAFINCTVDNTGSFTIIGNLPTYSVGVKPGTIGGQLEVYVNGQKLPRFLDATSTPAGWYSEIDGNSIRLDSNYGGLPFEFEVIKRVGTVDVTDDNVTNLSAINEIYQDKFQNALDQDFFLRPVNASPLPGQFRSDITNRAAIPDLTKDLLPRFGINRIPIQSLIPVYTEQGANGEKVFKTPNDRGDQIRLVGEWSTLLDTNGTRANSVSTNDYMEVVFLGTGLNVLTLSQTTDLRASVDGGAEGSNLFPAASFSVLNGQNYAVNVVLPVVSGLTFGLHTVKLRLNSPAMVFYGVEILNEGSSIKIPPGSVFANGKKTTHATLDSISYNSGFETGSLGTKGGRVIVYLKPDGSIGKAVTPTDATSHTLSSTDHSNEEVIRVYNWREFGSGRSNDFAVLQTSNQDTFGILEDDTTSLVGLGVSHGAGLGQPFGLDDCHLDDPNDFLTINFVGTGLDVVRFESATGNDTIEYDLDGVLLSSAAEAGFGKTRTFKLASGLSYGEHTFRIKKITQNNWSLSIMGYKVYGPKKPALPNGAVELSEYYVLGNFVANATAGTDYIGSGLIRKFANREFNYSGNGFTLATQSTGFPGGADVSSPNSGNYFEYTFFGTGFVRNIGNPDNAVVQINANGVALNTTNYPGMVSSTFGSVSFVAATGVLTDTSGTPNSGLNISGLPLALYTIRFTNTNGGGNGMQTTCLDIITPIHAPKLNKQWALQNTLNVGSQGLSDSRETSIHVDLSQSKNIVQCGSTGSPGSSVTSFHPVPDLSAAIFVRSNKLRISWTIDGYNGGGANEVEFHICVDGVKVGEILGNAYNNQLINHDSLLVPVTPGFHHVMIVYKTVSSTAQLIGHDMTVEEA